MSDNFNDLPLTNDDDVIWSFPGSLDDDWLTTIDVISDFGGEPLPLTLPSDGQPNFFVNVDDIILNAVSSSDGIFDIRQSPPTSSTAAVREQKRKSGVRIAGNSTEKPPIRKRIKKTYAQRDTGRWKPYDDLLLIVSVLQVNDLDIVWNTAKFSSKFTQAEIQTRWKALLYDELVSRTARAAIRRMHPELHEAVHRRAPFSLEEEDLLSDISSTDNPDLEDFQRLLDEHAPIFYQSRTTKVLQKHWRLLRQYGLLCDQRATSQRYAGGEIPPSLSETEAELTLDNVKEIPYQANVNQEMKLMDQQTKRKARLLEDELGHWMQLLGAPSKAPDPMPKFDAKTFAILRGQKLRYPMRKNFISFGRKTKKGGDEVDVDLTEEGPVHKVSRYQGAIELRPNGRFSLGNFGKRPFYVDGRPVFAEKIVTLRNNSVIEIYEITLIFLINKKLVEDTCFNDIESD